MLPPCFQQNHAVPLLLVRANIDGTNASLLLYFVYVRNGGHHPLGSKHLKKTIASACIALTQEKRLGKKAAWNQESAPKNGVLIACVRKSMMASRSIITPIHKMRRSRSGTRNYFNTEKHATRHLLRCHTIKRTKPTDQPRKEKNSQTRTTFVFPSPIVIFIPMFSLAEPQKWRTILVK